MLTTAPSILFQTAEHRDKSAQAPEYFADLHLDEIIETIVAGKDEYDLRPFFYRPLREAEAIAYRHEVFRDLEGERLFRLVETFAERMRLIRQQLTQKLYCELQKQAWLLIAVQTYCDAVERLVSDLTAVELESRGLLAFRTYLREYAASELFAALRNEALGIAEELAQLRYCILIRENGFTVRKYEGEPDYGGAVEATFEQFRQGAVKSFRVQFRDPIEMNHVEEKVLEFVARLYPEQFAHLDSFCRANIDFIDAAVGAFDREIQFYVAYLQYAAVFRTAGLEMCYPHMLNGVEKRIASKNGFDLALAGKLVRDGKTVVCNDFHLEDGERIIVVSGPNQGGKTTFARAFGQMHYLAALGALVPGGAARLFLFDCLYTHFERQESIENLRSKLEDDLVRLRGTLDRATQNSILILNEIFNSTTIADAIFLSREIMQRLIGKDLLAVWVTFIDELASVGPQTVSMTSMVVPENPARRTYKIVRRPADGLAYALAIAEKHHVTYAALKERLKS